AAYCYVTRSNHGWTGETEHEAAEARRLARHAVQLGKDDAVALCMGGLAIARVVGDLPEAASFVDRALVLNPNLAVAWNFSGWVRIWLREPEIAIDHMRRAIRLDPVDPLLFGVQHGIATAHFLGGRYDEASLWAENVLRGHPDHRPAMRMLAA